MTSSKLKIIAIISMIFSHTAMTLDGTTYVITDILSNIGIPWFIGRIFSFDYIGRIAFPIFAYLIAESCRHTKDIKYFMIRLLMFGIISQIFYRFALHPEMNGILSVFMSDLNIFYTLFLGVLSVYLYEKMREKDEHIVACFCPLIACCILAEVFKTDYALWGVLLIFGCYIIKSEKIRLATVGVWIFCLYFLYSDWRGFSFGWLISLQNGYINNFFSELVGVLIPMLAVLFLALYNGERGAKFKYLFYAVYPVHLAILMILKFIL